MTFNLYACIDRLYIFNNVINKNGKEYYYILEVGINPSPIA